MALGPRLEFRQSQQLVMTPQLQQAIKLLQLSNLELADFVDQELERNPLLEKLDNIGEAKAPEPPAATVEASDRNLRDEDRGFERAENLDTGQENLYGDDIGSDRAGMANGGDGDAFRVNEWASTRSGAPPDDSDRETVITREPTLREHVSEQLPLVLRDPTDLAIATALVDSLSETGYLSEPVSELAERLGIGLAHVERVLAACQTLEPSGCFARSLQDCLAIQLREQDRYDPAMQALVENLPLLARRDHASLREICGVDSEDLQDMIAELRRLNPKPGLIYGGEPAHTVVPDVFVRESNHGGWTIELNSETLPRLLVNNRYHASIRSKVGKEDKVFLTDCLQTANWLVKSLDQRARTILKVSTEIVRQQDAFFAHGVSELRPLTLKAVADVIDIHESTVSRVTANKYMGTPRGLLAMKFFFTSAIQATEGGEAFAAESVRHRIKILIDAEKPGEVLSDDRIVEMLKDKGIQIARRTVAKYREAMSIPSSVDRRRAKAALV